MLKQQTRRKKPGLENYSVGLAGFRGGLAAGLAGLDVADLGFAAGLRLGAAFSVFSSGASGVGVAGSVAFFGALAFEVKAFLGVAFFLEPAASIVGSINVAEEPIMRPAAT